MEEDSKILFKSKRNDIKYKFKNLKYKIAFFIFIVFLLLLKNYNYYKYYLFTYYTNKEFHKTKYNHNNEIHSFSINKTCEITSNNSYINKHLINKTVNIINKFRRT